MCQPYIELPHSLIIVIGGMMGLMGFVGQYTCLIADMRMDRTRRVF